MNDDANHSIPAKLRKSPADGALADAQAPAHLGMSGAPVLLQDLDDGSVDVVHDGQVSLTSRQRNSRGTSFS